MAPTRLSNLKEVSKLFFILHKIQGGYYSNQEKIHKIGCKFWTID